MKKLSASPRFLFAMLFIVSLVLNFYFISKPMKWNFGDKLSSLNSKKINKDNQAPLSFRPNTSNINAVTEVKKISSSELLTEASLPRSLMSEFCLKSLSQLQTADPKTTKANLEKLCLKIEQLNGCNSQKGHPIFHYDVPSTFSDAQRILTFALIHGDELPSGVIARSWMLRLDNIQPRSSWRIIPILNPDGWKARSRVNANGVDLNRNFPTEDWALSAHNYWKTKSKKSPRRFPGNSPASEPETQCAIAHIRDFKPDFIVSIHTPYAVLDLDGPKMKYPRFEPLPWLSLGTYPGSLGRYMWQERRIPVLTIELDDQSISQQLSRFDRLQDISGSVAIRTNKILRTNTILRTISSTRPEIVPDSLNVEEKDL